MSAENKKSMGWTVLLIALGVVALIGGVQWLAVLIPAAILIWFSARPTLGSGRN